MRVLLCHSNCIYPLCCVCLHLGASKPWLWAYSCLCWAGVKDNALLEMDCQTWTSPVFSFPFQKWQNNDCFKSKEVKVWWLAVWNNLAICNGAWFIAQQIKIPQWNGKWDVLDCAAFYLGGFCQAVRGAGCAVHSHSALPQASSLGAGTQPLALEMFPIQAQASDILTPGFACLYFPSPSLPFSVPHSYCASSAICQGSQRVLCLCAFTLPPVINSPCARWALQWCQVQLWAWGCAFPLTPSLLLVPSCTVRFWFTDHTCLLTKQALFQKVTLSNILSYFWKFYLKYPFQPWVFTSHLKKEGSFV